MPFSHKVQFMIIATKRVGEYQIRIIADMTIDLPTPLAHDTAALIARMAAIVGRDNVLTAVADLATYECDGFTIAKTRPDVVVFPTSTEHIVAIVKACNDLDVPFLARGAGT